MQGKKISLDPSDVEGVAIKEEFRCFKNLFMFLNFSGVFASL